MLEHPRDPRGYLKFQDPLFPDVVSFWRTSLWSEYAMEAGLHTFSFDMAAMGKAFARHTTLGTNLPPTTPEWHENEVACRRTSSGKVTSLRLATRVFGASRLCLERLGKSTTHVEDERRALERARSKRASSVSG